MNFVKKYSASVYLGGSLAYAGIPFPELNFFIVIIPTLVLLEWAKSK